MTPAEARRTHPPGMSGVAASGSAGKRRRVAPDADPLTAHSRAPNAGSATALPKTIGRPSPRATPRTGVAPLSGAPGEPVRTGVTVHVCGHRDKRFRSPGKLAKHERVHTRDAPSFYCSFCPRSSASRAWQPLRRTSGPTRARSRTLARCAPGGSRARAPFFRMSGTSMDPNVRGRSRSCKFPECKVQL